MHKIMYRINTHIYIVYDVKMDRSCCYVVALHYIVSYNITQVNHNRTINCGFVCGHEGALYIDPFKCHYKTNMIYK